MNQTLLNQELFSFIKESPTNYHAITAASRLLANQGFTPLFEQDAWTLLPGGKYYVSRGETSLFAFRMPQTFKMCIRDREITPSLQSRKPASQPFNRDCSF